MKNLLVRKLALSLVLALVAPMVLALLLKAVLVELHPVDGLALAERLAALPDAWVVCALTGVVFFVVAFISAQAVPIRRRRNRSSGTVVESDVDDGRERGMVKWFNVKKGFGFITWDDGEDVFVHFRSIRGQGHRSLTEGQRVKFMVVRGQKGPQAEDVSVVRD